MPGIELEDASARCRVFGYLNISIIHNIREDHNIIFTFPKTFLKCILKEQYHKRGSVQNYSSLHYVIKKQYFKRGPEYNHHFKCEKRDSFTTEIRYILSHLDPLCVGEKEGQLVVPIHHFHPEHGSSCNNIIIYQLNNLKK